MHLLCRELQEEGYDCKMFYPEVCCMPGESVVRYWAKSMYRQILCMFRSKNEDDVSLRTNKRCYIPVAGNNTIVIYPERYCKNVLFAKNVVRWLLNTPSNNVVRTWGKKDLVFAYREVFDVPSINPQKRILTLLSFDQSLFRQTNYGNRHGQCYILRKGKGRQDLPEFFDGPVIDDWTFEQQVKVLNETKFCYIYDTQTGYGTIAAMCGCIPVIIMEPGKTKADYVKGDDVTYGVAYGASEEEISYAIETRPLLYHHLDMMEIRNKVAINFFLNECRMHFQLRF